MHNKAECVILSAWQVEVGGLGVQGHPQLHSKLEGLSWATGDPTSKPTKAQTNEGKAAYQNV